MSLQDGINESDSWARHLVEYVNFFEELPDQLDWDEYIRSFTLFKAWKEVMLPSQLLFLHFEAFNEGSSFLGYPYSFLSD